MRNFIVKTLSFLIPVLLTLFIGLSYINYSIKKHIIKVRLDSKITSLYIGDSHIETAVFDSLLTNGKNLARSSESYYYSYHKLNKILLENSSVKRVFLGFGYHSFSNTYDETISGKYSVSVSSVYFFILPIAEQLRCLYWNRGEMIAYIKELILTGIKSIDKKKHVEFMGGYLDTQKNPRIDQQILKDRISYLYYKKDTLQTFSQINQEYFEKIIELCNSYKIDVILFETPLHPQYRAEVPQVFRLKYLETIEKYKLPVLDYADLSLPETGYLPDGDHVSREGAIITTREILKSGINLGE